MDGSLIPEQTVLIAGNRIMAVGPTDEVADTARCGVGRRLQAAYLIPGLWDMHVHSVGPVAADTANRSIARPGLAPSPVSRLRRHRCSQYERRHRRRDARADKHDQAPAGGGKSSRPTPIPQRRPCGRWRSLPGIEQEGRRTHRGGGSRGGGTAGLEWRRFHQGLRERLQGGLLRDHRRGQAQGDPRGRSRPLPHHSRRGRRRRSAHGRASGGPRSGLLHRGRRRTEAFRGSPRRLRRPAAGARSSC